MRILLAEDEKRVSSFIQRGLKEEGFVVDVAADGEKALTFAELNPYALIILDVMLPKQDGIQVCKALRAKKIDSPILMLTAKSSTKDKVLGLNSGADDYLAKPFEFEEFIARVRALTRRKSSSKQTVLQIEDLTLDPLTV
jgi:DNA-binding response OmpR family regulator